jgi:hypothetical protein
MGTDRDVYPRSTPLPTQRPLTSAAHEASACPQHAVTVPITPSPSRARRHHTDDEPPSARNPPAYTVTPSSAFSVTGNTTQASRREGVGDHREHRPAAGMNMIECVLANILRLRIGTSDLQARLRRSGAVRCRGGGELVADREAVGHLGSPWGARAVDDARAESASGC